MLNVLLILLFPCISRAYTFKISHALALIPYIQRVQYEKVKKPGGGGDGVQQAEQVCLLCMKTIIITKAFFCVSINLDCGKK